jgi:RecA-family ATPase
MWKTMGEIFESKYKRKFAAKDFFDANVITIYFGVGDTTKTLFSMYTMLKLLKGSQIKGFPEVVGKYEKIAYFTKEQDRKIKERIRSIAKGVGIKESKLKNRLLVCDELQLSCNAKNAEAYSTYITYIEGISQTLIQKNIQFIVIDSLCDFHDESENDNSGMNKVMAHIKRLCSIADCGALVVHHAASFGKNKTPRDRMRGATAIWDSVNNVLEFSRRDSKFKITFCKNNYFPDDQFRPITYVVDRDTLCPVREKDSFADNIAAFCKDETPYQALASRIKSIGNIRSKKTIAARIKELTEDGYIKKIRRGIYIQSSVT